MNALKRILTISWYIVTGIFLLGIIIAGFTQTKFFKDRLRVILVSEISTSMNASLYLGTIRGNFVTGFTIDSVSIYKEDENFFTSGKINVRYDLLTFPKKILTFKHLIIEQPRILFSRKKRGDWNIGTLFKPPQEQSTDKFAWTIVLEKIELKNASITLVDSEVLSRQEYQAPQPGHVNYRNFTVKDLNLQLDAQIRPDNFSAQIRHVSFYSDQPEFELTHCKGSFTVTDKEIDASNVVIQTKRSYLELDARMKGLNIFEGIDLPFLRDDSTLIRMSARNIDFTEFKSFLPAVDFLEGSAQVELDGEGTFGNLGIQRLYVQTYGSTLRLAGKLQNLHDPDNLYLDMMIGDSRLTPSDAAKLMPSFNIPEFADAGLTNFYAHYKGKPLDFKTTATVKGSFGNFELDGGMNLQSKFPRYDLLFTTDELNLQNIIGSPEANTLITSHGEVHGEGLSLENISAQLELSIDSARFRNLTVESSNIHINALPNKLEGNIALNALNSKANVTGTIDFSEPNRPVFESQYSLEGFDLSSILNDRRYSTNLNVRSTISGSGRTIDNLNGDASLTILPSTIGHYDLAPEEMTFSLDQRDPAKKHLALHSSIADIEAYGKFDIDIASATLRQQIENLVQSVVKHVTLKDSGGVLNKTIINTVHEHTAEQRQLDFDYSINIKNLETISGILEEQPFNTKGMIHGHVLGSDQSLSLSGNGSFEEFFIGTIHDGILLRNGDVSFDAQNLSMQQTLQRLSGTMTIAVKSGVTNMASFDSLAATLHFENAENYFSIRGIIDSSYQLSLHGKSAAQPQAYAIDLDSLTLRTGTITWNNVDDIQVRINNSGLRILHATMKHNEELASLTGSISDTGQLDMAVSLRNISLEEINPLLHQSKQPQNTIGFEGRITSDIHLGGTAQSPIINFKASGENIFYRQSRMGTVFANIRYANQLAAVDISVQPSAPDSMSGLIIEGTLPIDLAFRDVKNRFPDHTQNLHIRSKSFDLAILEPLLREFENLTGTVTCNVTITGTPKKPQYAGALSIQNARFILVPNNVAYIVSGDLEPSGEKIYLKNFSIKNVPEDKVDGEALVIGSITIKDFAIENFDLRLYGQLLFMNNATRKVIPTMYGTLFAAMDTSGLSLTGTLDRPFLSGNLSVKDANLVFPPTKVSGTNASAFQLQYIVIDDTTKYRSDNSNFSKQFYSTTDSMTSLAEPTLTPSEISLIDRVRYDVSIETQGPTRIRMIFTPSTNEELYAELEGKVNAVNNSGTAYIYGEISISPRSYYNFFKKFDATGKLNFVGQWDNPELDIHATYQGIRMVDTIDQKVFVNLAIAGTRYEPKLTMEMKVQNPQDKEPIDWASQAKGGDVQSDVISFILTGKFHDDLTSRDKEGIVSNVGATAGTSAVTGFTTSFLSGMLTDFLQKEFSFIRSAEVSYRGGNLQESADLRLSGEAFKGYWRFGGRIFNDIGNANVNYQISLGEVFNATSIKNLFIELERKVEGSEFEERKLTNAARIYYRISF